MTERTNDQRATRAEHALKAYKDYCQEFLGPDFSEDITDLLVDLHHYLVIKGLVVANHEAKDAMDNMLVTAAGHFDAETEE